MPSKKYTKELLEPLVKESVSVMEIIRKLGLTINSGGTHSYISSLISCYEIDTSHFLGARANSGKRHKGGPYSRKPEEVLILRISGGRERHKVLKRSLISIGRSYCCYICKISEWQGKSIVLEIEHKNGNPLDDRQENIEFICPNCHSQTNTYCGRNQRLS